MEFLLLLIIPLMIITIIKFVLNATISWKEYGIHIAASMFFTVMIYSVGSYYSTMDYELWNGAVSAKIPVRKNCPSGWVDYSDSFCTEYDTRSVPDGTQTCSTSTDSQGNTTTSCYPNYKTQYHYDFPWEKKWFVESKDISVTWEIKRIDRQGGNEPPRFSEINVGDPVSKTNSYQNWVAAASDSVFHEDGEKEERYVDLIPEYPIQIYDYYKVDRVIPVGIEVADLKKYNHMLSDILKDLGPQRQMNAVIVLSDGSKTDIDYAYAVRRAWKGFKKNDAVIFVGLNEGSVAWSEVLSWSKNSIFNVELREFVLAQKSSKFNLDSLIHKIHEVGMKSYERRSMEEFEFLKDQIPVPMSVILTIIILQFILGIGATFFFHKNEI